MNRQLISLVRLRQSWFAICLWALAACSPTYNWRELAVDGDLAAWMPCKPQQISREVHVGGGQPLLMTMLACEAGGQSWAISRVGAVAPAQLVGVQQALNEALAANLGTHLSRAQTPKAPGLAVAEELRRYVLHGRRPDGSTVAVDLWSFARGTQIYQASAMRAEASGDEPDALEARQTFFGALRMGR